MITLDASVLIAHFHSADAHHDAATALLTGALSQELIVHPMTVAEVLVGAVRNNRVLAMQARLDGMRVGVAVGDPAGPLRLAELRVRTRLKLPDCCVLDIAQQRDAALATFDGPLAAVARSLGIPVLGAVGA